MEKEARWQRCSDKRTKAAVIDCREGKRKSLNCNPNKAMWLPCLSMRNSLSYWTNYDQNGATLVKASANRTKSSFHHPEAKLNGWAIMKCYYVRKEILYERSPCLLWPSASLELWVKRVMIILDNRLWAFEGGDPIKARYAEELGDSHVCAERHGNQKLDKSQ